ncbi:type II secretion system protein GspL [Pantoea endophytica]|uniref:Type II secretion system protein GspL n=1 Tax=Pantoea sp. BJ2 TaxID=3141322 RepID=A0AAU7U399_9GAMM
MRLFGKTNRSVVIFYQSRQDFVWLRKMPGHPVQQGCVADGLPDLTHHEIVMLIPVHRVTLAKVSLLNARDEALKWQLEPLATQGIDELHITRLETTGGEHLMAVTDAEWFKQTLDEMREMGINPHRVLPDVMVVNPGERWLTHDGWLLRLQDGTGLHLSTNDLTSFPELMSLHERIADPLNFIAEGVNACAGNMLQGPFSVRRSLRRPVTALVFAGLFYTTMLIGIPLIQGMEAERSIDELNKQALVRYQHYFPNETPSAPLRAFSRRIANSKEVQNSNTLLGVLHENVRMLNSLNKNPLRELEWDLEEHKLELNFRDVLPKNLISPSTGETDISVKNMQLIMSKKP